jgi:PBP1b-binding outer membrane lipoprotein LpoB
MKKLTSLLLLSALLLSSCTQKAPEVVQTEEKKPFYVDIKTLSKTQQAFSIEKTARITAGSSLVLTAESVGEVVNISVKE